MLPHVSQHWKWAIKRWTVPALATVFLVRNLSSKNMRFWNLGFIAKCLNSAMSLAFRDFPSGPAIRTSIFSPLLHKSQSLLPVIKGVGENVQSIRFNRGGFKPQCLWYGDWVSSESPRLTDHPVWQQVARMATWASDMQPGWLRSWVFSLI